MRRALTMLAVAALAGAGCGSTPTSPSNGVVRLTMSQNPTFSPDSLVFSMRLDNISQGPVDLTFPSGCDMLPMFTDSSGREVTPAGGGFACTAVVTRVTLQPGMSVIRPVTVKAGAAPEGSFVVLPAGSYRAAARLMDSTFKMQSDPVPFTLR